MQLIGSRWVLQAMKGHKLLVDPSITLYFFPDRFSGDDGCNSYSGGFFISLNNKTKWTAGRQQDGPCQEPRKAQSDFYISKIYDVTQYKIEGTILSFLNEKSEVLLQYKLLPKNETRHDYLLEKTWRLSSKNDTENLKLGNFTIKFEENKLGILSFKGTSNCGGYQGTYKVIDDKLNSLQNIDIKTDFFNFLCTEENALSEKEYIDFLKHVQKHKAGEQHTIELYSDNGKKLDFGWWDRM